MAMYVSLIQFTDQGIRNVKDTIKRGEAAMAEAEKMGIKIIEEFWTMISQYFRAGGFCSFCALHGNDKVIEPHEQAGELDAVDTTTYFRRYDGKRTIEELRKREFRNRR